MVRSNSWMIPCAGRQLYASVPVLCAIAGPSRRLWGVARPFRVDRTRLPPVSTEPAAEITSDASSASVRE
jgi:hypothetical protein